MEVRPEPWPKVMLETVGSRVARSVGVGRAAPARVLPGLLRLSPARVLPGETAPPLCFFAFLVLALLWLSWASVFPWFTSLALLGVALGAAPTARAQVKG